MWWITPVVILIGHLCELFSCFKWDQMFQKVIVCCLWDNIQTFLGVLKYFLGSLYILTHSCWWVCTKNPFTSKVCCWFFAYGQSHSTASLRLWFFRVYRLQSLWPWTSCGVGWSSPSSPSAGGYRTTHGPLPSPDGDPLPFAQSPETMACSSPQNFFLRLP